MGATDENPEGRAPARTTALFIEALWADIADAFQTQFGTRWTPEVQQHYQDAQRGALQAVRLASGDVVEPPAEPVLRRVLSNYTRDRG